MTTMRRTSMRENMLSLDVEYVGVQEAECGRRGEWLNPSVSCAVRVITYYTTYRIVW